MVNGHDPMGGVTTREAFCLFKAELPSVRMTSCSDRTNGVVWGAAALCATCSILGGLAIGRWLSPVSGVPVILVSALLSGRVVARSYRGVGSLLILGAFGATVLVGVLSARLGNVWLRHALRGEIARLGPTIARHQPVPDSCNVPQSGILQRAIIREDARGNGLVARFPLGDGSAIDFFSNRSAKY